MNIIRLWANNRANRALTLFRMRNFNPGLFSDVPGILPYLRFDFFKALSMQGLSEEVRTIEDQIQVMKSTGKIESDGHLAAKHGTVSQYWNSTSDFTSSNSC
nr:heat shock protein 90 [Crinivirus sp.]